MFISISDDGMCVLWVGCGWGWGDWKGLSCDWTYLGRIPSWSKPAAGTVQSPPQSTRVLFNKYVAMCLINRIILDHNPLGMSTVRLLLKNIDKRRNKDSLELVDHLREISFDGCNAQDLKIGQNQFLEVPTAKFVFFVFFLCAKRDFSLTFDLLAMSTTDAGRRELPSGE